MDGAARVRVFVRRAAVERVVGQRDGGDETAPLGNRQVQRLVPHDAGDLDRPGLQVDDERIPETLGHERHAQLGKAHEHAFEHHVGKLDQNCKWMFEGMHL